MLSVTAGIALAVHWLATPSICMEVRGAGRMTAQSITLTCTSWTVSASHYMLCGRSSNLRVDVAVCSGGSATTMAVGRPGGQPTFSKGESNAHVCNLACSSMYIMSFCITCLLHPSLSPNVHYLSLPSSAVKEDLYLYGGVDQEDTFVCALELYVFSTGVHLH